MHPNHVLFVAMATVAALAAVGHARAGEIADEPAPFVSTATRAQVQQDLRQFRATGIDPWAHDYNPLAQFRSDMTRADVRGEYLAEHEEAAALNGEDSGSSYLARAHAPSMRHGPVELLSAK